MTDEQKKILTKQILDSMEYKQWGYGGNRASCGKVTIKIIGGNWNSHLSIHCKGHSTLELRGNLASQIKDVMNIKHQALILKEEEEALVTIMQEL